MIEGCFAFLTPVHQFEVHTMMLHVAALASLLGDSRVEPSLLVELLTQNLVAVQTALGRDPLLLAMTPQTPVTALEIRVRRAQRAR